MTEIKDGAFTNCSGVTTFDFGDGSAPVAWYDYSFAGSRPGRNSVPLFYGSGPALMSGAGQESSLCRVALATRGAVSITHINASRIFAGCSGLSCVLFGEFPAGSTFASKFSSFSVAVLSAAGEVVSFSPRDPSSIASLCGLSALAVSGIPLDHVCGAFDPNFVPVAGVTLSESMKSLEVGNTFDLVATVAPDDATIKNVTWTSSDPSVASDGLKCTVNALKAGNATLTVTTEDDGFTATCEVTVTEASDAPSPGPTRPSQTDRSSWGTPYVREADGVTPYVVENPTSPDFGLTSIELTTATAVLGAAASRSWWIRENAAGTSAWYGLAVQMPDPIVGDGYRFYVQLFSYKLGRCGF